MGQLLLPFCLANIQNGSVWLLSTLADKTQRIGGGSPWKLLSLDHHRLSQRLCLDRQGIATSLEGRKGAGKRQRRDKSFSFDHLNFYGSFLLEAEKKNRKDASCPWEADTRGSPRSKQMTPGHRRVKWSHRHKVLSWCPAQIST
jgi:hypothetical protein